MLEDQVAYLLQRYLGNYVRGLNKEALKISVWQGDVELSNMQLKPEALNALKLPVKVKAGFLGSVKIKVPWSRLGQDPVIVYLDRIFLLAEPATEIQGCSEDAIQEVKKTRIREMEIKLLERMQRTKTEMNNSWLGSLISTIIGNLKLSISNVHIRYEDIESNPGHPFAAGISLEKLSAVTIDNDGNETFITGGALDRIQKFVELNQLALYLDCDISPWNVDKPWEDLLPSEWDKVFHFGTKKGKPAERLAKNHSYILQPVSGYARYTKLRENVLADRHEPLQKASVYLDDVTLCLSKNGYRDILKLVDNFSAFNQRLKYAHYRPLVSVKTDPRLWWKYAFNANSDQLKKASGKMSWEQVLKFANLRKRYISLYASLLKSDPTRAIVDDDKYIGELDRELDIELILQWRMLAHKFVQKSVESVQNLKKEKAKKSWWSFGWNNQSFKDDEEQLFSQEDWEQLNKFIGYKEDDNSLSIMNVSKADAVLTSLEVHMNHNASKLTDEAQHSLAELSCEDLNCSMKFFPETKVFDINLGSYQLSSPSGLLAVSATARDSLVGVLCYKPFDTKLDWSLVAKASPCYMTYLKDAIEQILNFFESNTAVSQTIALETAAALQTTIDEVKRSAQYQVNRALKDHSRFLLDLDIAAPKITIPAEFHLDDINSIKLLIDLGNLLIRTQDDHDNVSPQELDMYLHFDVVLSDVSAFLVDGDYSWNQIFGKDTDKSSHGTYINILPIIDKCGVILKLQQIRSENPSYPSTRLAVRLPSLGFHFSPARYHRLLKILKIFQEDSTNSDYLQPWNQADFEGWLSVLIRKGVGNREAVWQRQYCCLVGPYLYLIESPGSKSYQRYLSLRGKQIVQLPAELVGEVQHVLAVYDAARSNNKVVEDAGALILRCDSDDSRKTWQNRLQGAIYRASASAPISGLSETSSNSEDSEMEPDDSEDMDSSMERVFMTGSLDELSVRFSSSNQHGQNFERVLLAEERCLMEFRAIGGHVELSIRSNDMFIGTILKSLEIEDLICSKTNSQSCYLARSFVHGEEAPSFANFSKNQGLDTNDSTLSEGDDNFFEAAETLVDYADYQIQSPGESLEYVKSQSSLQLRDFASPSFSRVAGLLPPGGSETHNVDSEQSVTLDNFVKAQIVLYDQNSSRYSNVDKQVTVTLATLSFFCRRPTVLALVEFANAVNLEEESCESFSDDSSSGIVGHNNPIGEDEQISNTTKDGIVKGLLGKGKSRTIFNLALKMSRAQIFLVKEDETVLSCLSQDNLLADIKVFPSSFSIEAALGNLRISDDSLPNGHMYYWACDMRNPGGSSFVELSFSSFNVDDGDYNGYEYCLLGKLSEVRIVYLNRFIQEVVSYFVGLVPENAEGVVKLKDQVTNSEKWFTTTEIEGLPALKLDLSLSKPIILMPRRTDSLDYLKLDIVHITIRNTFQWTCGSKTDMSAVHLEILTVLVDDINLNVAMGTELGESIIEDVKGVSVVIRRSLRDLLHQIPSFEVAIQMEVLKAVLSNKEYQLITECAMSNISETANVVPPIKNISASSTDIIEHATQQDLDEIESETSVPSFVSMKLSVIIDLVELCLRAGVSGDASLATVQANNAWLLYNSNTNGEGFLSATLKGFTVLDEREGTELEFRRAIGIANSIGPAQFHIQTNEHNQLPSDANTIEDKNSEAVPTMLILDAKFSQFKTFVSLSVQKPQLLVALDFLLAVVEFFVPTVGNILSDEQDKSYLHVTDAVILDQSPYRQPSSELHISPGKPLVADTENFDHFIYDGDGGVLHLKDRYGVDLSAPSKEAMIYVGSGKKLQFKNIIIKGGRYLDSCVFMGTNSSYSASKVDGVYLELGDNILQLSSQDVQSQDITGNKSTEYIIELQAIGPELIFYNTSREVEESTILQNQLLHAQLDVYCRVLLKGDTIEFSANALGLTMETNGMRILEPFNTSVNYSNASGKTNIHLSVSDIFMNFSFSILRLFLAVEEDIMAFLRMTSKKMTVVCSQFDKVGTIKSPNSDQVYSFWRPDAPPGFAVLGDYVTPSEKPPTKGVLAVNTSYARVKRPISFRLIWPPIGSGDISNYHVNNFDSSPGGDSLGQEDCFYSIWFPEAPKGYVALGCVVSNGIVEPPLSAVFCIATSLVSTCSLRDCISISTSVPCHSSFALWRVDNAAGSFLPADPINFHVRGTAYELRRTIFGFPEVYHEKPKRSDSHASSSQTETSHLERPPIVTSGQHFEAVANFQLIWWNRGSNSKKKLSIWRPVVPPEKIYFGDIVVKGFEPPNTSIVLHNTRDEELFKAPLGFQLVGQIKKQRGMENISFWLPQAPPGFVSLGCIACKGTPKQQDFSALGCMRIDMVTGDQFLEESAWDSSDARLITEPFSIWMVGNELGTFIVRSGFKRPPRRFALKLADSFVTSGSDNTVIDAEVRTLSIAVFDDYAGLMVPLFNISFSGLGFSLHGRKGYLNAVVSFSLAARSYNDKYESWEPLVEPVDGFLRYHYDQNAPGSASQLRLTSARDLNLNVSASNVNMLIQAYASWINLTHVHENNKKRDSLFSTSGGKRIGNLHGKRDYYIIPQNKLGQDIYIQATEIRGLQNVIRMPSGDMKPLKVPVSKNMLDSHLEGKRFTKDRRMVTIIISDGQLPRVEGPAAHQYTVAVRLTPLQGVFTELQHQQSARTSGSSSNHSLSSEINLVYWKEIFFFKLESPEKYVLELIVTDLGKGHPTGFFSAPLTQIAQNLEDELYVRDYMDRSSWIELASPELGKTCKFSGRISCTVLLSPKPEFENINQSSSKGRKSGFIQISPSRTGPWTTVRLNYATPAACWRLGNDVIASQLIIKDGSRYVTVRSLVSVQNNTDFMLDVCLMSKHCEQSMHLLDEITNSDGLRADSNMFVTEEFYETEKYNPTDGWVSCLKSSRDCSEGNVTEATSRVDLPSGWEWIDDWHLDKRTSTAADGWVYAPDVKSLKWPDSSNSVKSVNHARQRRWVRSRKQIMNNIKKEISIGQLKPGDKVPLPLSALTHSGLYIFHFRPSTINSCDEYSWSSIVDKPNQEDANRPNVCPDICVSTLSESEELLYCIQTSGTSSSSSHRLWFCLGIQASEISKDIHSDPIQDWNLVIKAPLSITNYLPLVTEFSVLEKQKSGHFIGCSRGILHPGKTVKLYDADIRNPLFMSLLPQRGWLPVHEAVLISHPHGVPSRTLNLRSSITGRIVQVILEQNHNKEHPFLEKIIRLYAPYWFSIFRCPPLTFHLVDISGRKHSRKIYLPFKSKSNIDISEEITEEEIHEGYTIASALNFNLLGLSVSINQTGKNQFGPIKDLSPLGDMDGSVDLYAYDDEGKCMQLFISTKPCPHQSVPTKVICVRPFMTFTNRLGRAIFIKLSNEDEPKVLHPCDSRISFAFQQTDGHDKLQVRLQDTSWSFPLEIIKEDTIFLVLRRYDGTRTFLRMEIRGYEEGSRFIIVFRVGSTDGPIRVENRTGNTISIRQNGFGEEAWILLPPLSTTNFCWEDPYSLHFLDTKINGDNRIGVWKLDDSAGLCSLQDGETELCCHVAKEGDIKVVTLRDAQHLESDSHDEIGYITAARNWRSQMQGPVQDSEAGAPTELIVELGVVGVSIIDHRPKELAYMYLERVFISYSTGYDGGATNRFKLILGNLQLDNQLPLTLMPVLLAPDQTTDVNHPAFKMTVTMQNENSVGIQVFPYIYVRVNEKSWRLTIHEPVIWAVVDFYSNLQLGRLPQSSSITQVDPEIRINLIDISEVKLKVVLETAPAQRPHGVLGIWSPILSAVGNAFKIQVHLRRVMHRDRYMRKSSILPAVGNRIWRDFIHNPLHLIFSLDVLGMTSSTLASLSKGFAELSTDGQFLQLRSKQVWSRRITGVRDGIIQGTEALAQGVAFGVSGVVTKPVESARQNGLLGLAHGLGRAFLGFIVQPVSGALDFFSLTVDGIGASCSKCLEVFNKKASLQRVRNPRAIHADGILREYCEREAVGQMVLHLAEGSTHFGCTEIFKEPSKFAFSDYYEEHFIVPYQRIVLVTNKRVMLLQCPDPEKMDKKPSKILWDVPWEELMALELAKVAQTQPSHLIIHLKSFKRAENFVRVIKCHVEEIAGREPQAVRICSVVRKLSKEYQSDMKSLVLKVPSSQRHVYFAWSEADGKDANTLNKSIIKSRELLSSSSSNDDGRFVKHSINFAKVWSSELELKGRCILCKKQAVETGGICTIWRPICPDGYVSIGDIAHLGSHPPNVAAIYRHIDGMFAPPVGYDLVWRNCQDDYITPLSIWHPRAPEGFVSPGCIAVANFAEPEPNLVYCVAESLAEETVFEEQKIWSAPDAYPWACHIYQMQSDALHFVALRQSKEESDWKPMRVLDNPQGLLQSSRDP